MSDAIEGADVMLYGVSLAYKESANVSGLSNTSSESIWYSLSGSCSPRTYSDAAVACNLQCRMEANYAHQQELDMIPLMMQKDYSPKGWLGLILGTRMWYAPCTLRCLSAAVILLWFSLIEMYFLSACAGTRCGTRSRKTTLRSSDGWTVWCGRSQSVGSH